MTHKRTTLWLALALAIAAAATAVPPSGAQGERLGAGGWEPGEHPRMEQFHEERLERMIAFLDLSEQQALEWRRAIDGRKTDRGAEAAAMHSTHERIRELAAADNPDARAIGELVIEAHRRREVVAAEREAFHGELMTILTPEQQERFEALQELRPEHGRRGHRGHRPGHDRGGRLERRGPAG